MVQNRSSGLTLFELLARGWTFDDEVAQVEFNHSDTAVLFRFLSGKLALVTTDDSESPKSRTRIEIDTGRTTIQQRKKPVPAADMLPMTVLSELPVVPMGKSGFLAMDDANVLQKINFKERSVAKDFSLRAVTAMSSSQRNDMLAIAESSQLTIHNAITMSTLMEVTLHHNIAHMSFSHSGMSLAVWGEDRLTLVDVQNLQNPAEEVGEISNVTQVTWDSSGKYLACASSMNEFNIVSIEDRTVHSVQDYPCPVNNAVFSESGSALITSGAFRLAGWSTDDLPKHNHAGTPLASGKSGLIPITAIAAHPKRSLAAAGYANGLVTITNIGTPQEMMVHQEAETKVSQLAWSNTGEHLAICFGSGKAAIVTFPDQLFK